MSEPSVDFEYIALSAPNGWHHVCIRRNDKPEWLKIVASFPSQERAVDYAYSENFMAEEFCDDPEHRPDTNERPPEIETPPSGLQEFRQWVSHTIETLTVGRELIERHEPEDARQPQTEPQRQQPRHPVVAHDDDPPAAGSIPQIILRLLPHWMEKYPGGPTIKQVTAETKLREVDVREAFNELRDDGRASVYRDRESDGQPYRVTLPDVAPKDTPELSVNQEALLGYLATLEPSGDDTVTPPNQKHMEDASGVPKGSLGATIDSLERRGKIEIVERGHGPLQKPRYKVVDRQILRQAIARESGQPRDVSSLVFDDPAPERSALAEKQRHEGTE